jgi:hypothetical protein
VVTACYKERSERGKAAMAMIDLANAPADRERDVTIAAVAAMRPKLPCPGDVRGERAPR